MKKESNHLSKLRIFLKNLDYDFELRVHLFLCIIMVLMMCNIMATTICCDISRIRNKKEYDKILEKLEYLEQKLYHTDSNGF
jgi:hypothetical protein